jgi:hypothetical protein
MRVPVVIIDNHTGQPVEAELFDDVTMDHFLEAQAQWRPVVVLAARRLAQSADTAPEIPRHWHWDWTRKEPELGMLAITFIGLECRGRLQGLMKVEKVTHRCRLPEQLGKPLVYIDYLEVAPWNVKPLMDALGRKPEFRGVGTRLLEAAVRISEEEGFKGRVGLHSLDASEGFYLQSCKMLAGERDPAKQELLWCEFTPERAQQFLTGGNP